MEFWLGFWPPHAKGHIRSAVWDNRGVRRLVFFGGIFAACPFMLGDRTSRWSMVVQS